MKYLFNQRKHEHKRPKFDPILPDILNVMTYIVFLTKQEAMLQQKGWRIFFVNEKLKSPFGAPSNKSI